MHSGVLGSGPRVLTHTPVARIYGFLARIHKHYERPAQLCNSSHSREARWLDFERKRAFIHEALEALLIAVRADSVFGARLVARLPAPTV